jgi:hypothetical protein
VRIARDLIVPGGGGTAAGGAGSNTLGMSNLGNTAGTTGVVSGSALRYLFAGGNNITLSQSVNGQSATLSIIGGAGAAAGSGTFGISNLGNTSGTSGTIAGSNVQFLLAGGNNITISQSINGSSATLTISAFTQTVQTQNMVVLIASGANGNGTFSSGTLSLKAGSNITLSTGANVISYYAPDVPSETFGISNLGNTSGTSGVISGSALQQILVGGNNITLSQSINGASATITISQQLPYQSRWSPNGVAGTSVGGIGNGFGLAFPMTVIAPVTATVVNQLASISMSSSSNSSYAGVISVSLGIYSNNASTWSLATSGSQSYQFTNTSSNSFTNVSGLRLLSIPMNVNMTPGYYMAVVYSQTSTTNANWFTALNVFQSGLSNAYLGIMNAGSATGAAIMPGLGYINGVVSFASGLPSLISASSVVGGSGPSLNKPLWIDFAAT